METRASYVTVGAFVLVCLLGLIVSTLWIAGAQFRQEFALYRTYFIGPVTGLGRGTIVRYNGIESGTITELAFDRSNPRLVIVTMQINAGIPLHVDSVATIESLGLTGVVYVEISGGTANSPLVEAEDGQDYPVIPSRASTLQQLAAGGSTLLARFNTVGERIGDVLNDDNRILLNETLTSLRNTTSVIDRNSENLEAVMKNLGSATGGLVTTLNNVDRTLSSADRALTAIDAAVGSLNDTLASTNTTVQSFGRLADNADKVISGHSLAQLTQLLAQTRALVASLTRLSNDLEREPTRLIYGDQRQGYAPQ